MYKLLINHVSFNSVHLHLSLIESLSVMLTHNFLITLVRVTDMRLGWVSGY
jgi:hypothetical protein